MKGKGLVFVISTTAVMLGTPIFAQAETIAPVDTFFVSAGVYSGNNDMNLRWHPTSGSPPGAHLDFKNDLGFDLDGTEPVFEIGGSFGHGHKGNRHQLKAFRYGHDGHASMTLTDDYQIGDDLYVEGAAFEGDLDVDMLGLSYTWFFHHNRSSAFGVGLGAIRYDISASFAATAVVDQNIEAVHSSISESAWVPEIHAEYVKSLSDQWRIAVDASYIKKSGGRISGNAVDLGARVDYFPWQHFGFSLGYNYNDLSLDLDKQRFTGGADIKSHGPQLVATYRF